MAVLANWSPEAWTAIAAWATVGVAVTAAIAALWQVRELRRTRKEEAQPYVVVYMEPTFSPEFIDLVIQNFGKTAAYAVRVIADPPLAQTDGHTTSDLWLPEELPVLVPGQEWRTFWNSAMERKGSDLPAAHDVEVTYADSRGKRFSLESRLDWSVYQGRQWVGRKGIHEAAEALVEIETTVSKWTNSPRSGGLAVYSRDGDEWDRRKAEAYRGQIARLKEQEAESDALAAERARTTGLKDE